MATIVRTCMDCPPPTRENPQSSIMGCVDSVTSWTLTCKANCNHPEDCEVRQHADLSQATTGICDDHMNQRMEGLRRRKNGK